MKRVSIIITLLGALWLAPAAAEPPLGSDLDGLLAYARQHNPQLAAARQEAIAALQRSETADTLPDPVLRIEPMDVGNGIPATQYTLIQSVPWWGKRDLRREAADADAALAQGGMAASWAELAAALHSTWAMHYVLTGSQRLLRQQLDLIEQAERIARTRYASGLGMQADAIRAMTERTLLQSELIALENERHHTHVRLNALLARAPDAPLAEPERLPEMPVSLDEAAMQQRLLERSPQLGVAEAEVASAEKARALTYAERYPDFTLGIAPTQAGRAVKQWDLMIELTLPLQQSARRSREREAEARLSASHARRESLFNALRAELSQAVSSYHSAQRTEMLIATQLLPQTELAYRSALAAYETGKLEFTALIEAQRQLMKVRRQRLEAQGQMQQQLAGIARLTGATK